MTRPRFSIASLLALVVFVAVAVAALRAASELWDSALYTTLVAMLLASVLLVVHRAGKKRAFWLGFAVFGWVYLVASMVPHVEGRLLTTRGLAYLDSKVADRPQYTVYGNLYSGSQPPRASALAFSPDGKALAATQRGIVWLLDSLTGRLTGSGATSENFIRIGHTLIAFVMALIGGHLSRFLHMANRTEPYS